MSTAAGRYCRQQQQTARWQKIVQRSLSSTAAARRRTLVLGLESSADDSCAAVLEHRQADDGSSAGTTRILSSVVERQPVHAAYGGIHPLHAHQAHLSGVPRALAGALEQANVSPQEVDAIAATRGPGMYGCLATGLTVGKALAVALRKPLYAVHHMQAHALTPLLSHPDQVAFPFLTLLLSGGHTQIVLAKARDQFEILATTSDESIGACLDKGARALGISATLGNGSLGAALERYANEDAAGSAGDGQAGSTVLPTFPRIMPGQLAFSYSGLRTHLDRFVRVNALDTLDERSRRTLARSFLSAAVLQVEDKLALALKKLAPDTRPRALAMSGGVASNLFLRARIRARLDDLGLSGLATVFPPLPLCTDNAAMIAHVGLLRHLAGGPSDDPEVLPIAKWSIEQCESAPTEVQL